MQNNSTLTDTTDSRLRELSEAPVGRLLWHYSLPAVVGIMVMQLYNIVDRIFIGQVVGDDAIAGLAITFPLANISTALGVLVGGGASARVSIALGAGNLTLARQITSNALTLTLAIGIAYVAMFAIFADDILRLFGATDTTLPYARDMMLWILPGLLLTNLTFSFNSIMRASGFPRRAMVTMIIGAAVNIVLDPIFIYLFDWGIRGAALATDIAMAVGCLFVMEHFARRRGEVYVVRRFLRLSSRIVTSIFSIGAAPFIINIAACLINILINRTLHAHGGDTAIASAGVFVTVTAFVVCCILGICQGMQPVVGYNFGAGNYQRVIKAFTWSAIVSTVVCVIGFACGELIPDSLSEMFLTSDSTIEATSECLRISMSMFWMVGIQVVATTFFQSIGEARKSIFLSLTRQVLFIIPLLLIMPDIFGLKGVWMSFPSSDILAFSVTVAMICHRMKQLSRNNRTDSALLQ